LIEAMKIKMHRIQFASRVMMIHMKVMKVSCTMKNMMSQEFQHCMESQLIEAMTMKMHSIQFASSVTVIQMKLMKVIRTAENRMVQEFQHCPESQLTEGSRMKRPRIQSVLISNRVRTKSSETASGSESISLEGLESMQEPRLEL
jgi:hypothetical protein